MEDSFKGRILILDDDPSVGPYYDKILSRNGFQCDLAYNLGEMRTRLSAVTYDFVLLDSATFFKKP